jgi:hypothetical protein
MKKNTQKMSMSKKKKSWKICIILKPPTFKPQIFLNYYHKNFNTFSMDFAPHFSLIEFEFNQFNFNPFVELTLVEWKFNSNKFKSNQIPLNSRISIQFNSNCTQCHSIFSFKWNLIFTNNSLFHQIIIINNAH